MYVCVRLCLSLSVSSFTLVGIFVRNGVHAECCLFARWFGRISECSFAQLEI